MKSSPNCLSFAVLAAAVMALPPSSNAQDASPIMPPVHAALSLPMSQHARSVTRKAEGNPSESPRANGGGSKSDPVVQTSPLPWTNYASLGSITGLGYTFPGFTETFTYPDTNLAVGITHSTGSSYYVQVVNSAFAVFDKNTDRLLLGPVATDTLFAGLNNGCYTDSDGNTTVHYDVKYDRWIFAVGHGHKTPYMYCLAVSTTPDPTGSYFQYAFNLGGLDPVNDKMAIWPTGYFLSFDVYSSSGVSFVGPAACALDRAAAVLGNPLTPICYQLGTTAGNILLPADQDGATDPALPEYFLALGNNSLNAWTFVPNFSSPASSTFTGPSPISGVAAFSQACGGGACIPQPGSGTALDSVGGDLMYRVAYRNVAGVNYLVVDHSVNPNKNGYGVSGVRWYLMTVSGTSTTPAVVQQGTYAIDSNARWLGSVAMDKCGDLGVGYSISGKGSGGVEPGMRFAGRTPSDAPNNLESEIHLVDGIGSQTVSDWGDYSALVVDPSDGKTFYYANTYLTINGSMNWSTAISKVRFNACQ